MNKTFQRENRYFVIKRSDVDNQVRDIGVPSFNEKIARKMRYLLDEVAGYFEYFYSSKAINRQYVVVENDWPEYEIVWGLIKSRIEGTPNIIESLRDELAKEREAREEAGVAASGYKDDFYIQCKRTKAAEAQVAVLKEAVNLLFKAYENNVTGPPVVEYMKAADRVNSLPTYAAKYQAVVAAAKTVEQLRPSKTAYIGIASSAALRELYKAVRQFKEA